MQVVRERLVELALAEPLSKWPRWRKAPGQSPRQLCSSMKKDGSWADIPYENALERLWETSQHLNRLFTMAQAYRSPKSRLQGDRTLRKRVLAGIDCWLRHDIQGGWSSWWHDLIYVPRLLGKVLLMMRNDLSEDQVQAGIRLMKRSWPGSWGALTGENLVWLAEVTLMRALLEENEPMVAHVIRNIASELAIDSHEAREGIQADLSFHQHGPQIYNGGYGWDFVHDGPRLVWAAHGTTFAFSRESVEVLSQYLLDGVAWMMRRNWLDYGVQGRELVRMQNAWKVQRLIHACTLMVDMNVPRRSEFEVMLERLRSGSGEGEPVGHRHFWRSDYLSHRRPAWMVSVKMPSARTFNTEELRGENVPNLHQSDGVMQILRTGGEYDMILPVLDWRRLPGVTCQWESAPVEPFPNNVHLYHKTRFVGGVTDGTWGMAAFDFRQFDGKMTRWVQEPRAARLEVSDLRGLGLRARKAWFCFDREVVCVGTDIHCATEKPVFTSVNQCLLHGKVLGSDGRHAGELEPGQTSSSALQWVHHDGVGYYFPRRTAVTVVSTVQKGAWNDISRHVEREKRFNFRKKVFSLWVDHGVRPEGAGYVYFVLPEISTKALTDYVKDCPVKVLVNRRELQAVRHGKLRITQAAFYEAGTLKGTDGLSIAVDKPCLVMVQEFVGTVRVSVSNPENEPGTLHVEIGTKLAGPGCTWIAKRKVTRIQVDLPTGVHAGQSAVMTLSRST